MNRAQGLVLAGVGVIAVVALAWYGGRCTGCKRRKAALMRWAGER